MSRRRSLIVSSVKSVSLNPASISAQLTGAETVAFGSEVLQLCSNRMVVDYDMALTGLPHLPDLAAT